MALSDLLRRLGRSLLRSAGRAADPRGRRPGQRSAPWTGGYIGDYTGTATIRYAPSVDDVADPGEIVWAWVPFEEDHSRGKDRPVLVVGYAGRYLLALMLTSKDHARYATAEQRNRRRWVDIGSGPWDRQGRPSEVRVDRVLQLDPRSVRREGAQLDQVRFDRVAEALRERLGWR